MKTKILSLLLFLFSFNASATLTCTSITLNPDFPTYGIGSLIDFTVTCTSNIPGASLDYSWSIIGAPHEPTVTLIASQAGTGTVGMQVSENASSCGGTCSIFQDSITVEINDTPCSVDQEVDGVSCVDISTISPDGSPLNTYCRKCHAGDPVNVASGSLWHMTNDCTVKGRTAETSLKIDRMYVNNSATPPGDFGSNWRHNYETKLIPDFTQGKRGNIKLSVFPNTFYGNILWIDEFGGPWRFRRDSNGLHAPASLNATLTEFSDHYELRKQNGTKLFFGKNINDQGQQGIPGVPEGALYRIEEVHGEAVTLSYSGNLLESVSSPFAGSLHFVREAPSRQNRFHGKVLNIIRDRDNLSYTYTYVGSRLATATDFANNSYQYTYKPSSSGDRASGMLSSIIDPLNRTRGFSYYTNGKAYQQFEPGGAVRTFTYGDHKTSVKEIDGTTTKYFFDENFETEKVILPDGTRQYSTWTNGRVTETRRDHGGSTFFGYDLNGNLSSIKRPEDPSPTVIAYDQTFNKPTNIQPIVGAPTQFTLNPTTGDVMQVSRGGLSLGFTRDGFGNLLSTNNGKTTYADQRNTNGFLTTKFDLHNPETRTYDTRGRVATRSFAAGRSLSYTYDDYDRVLTIMDSHGPDIVNTYDAMGKLTERKVTDGSTNQITSFSYDNRDRLQTVTDALNRTTVFGYDPVKISDKPISITDPANRTTYFEYDSLQRLVKKTQANGAVTKFTYDQDSNLTSVTDANGGKTVYSYDLNGRKIREQVPSVAGTTDVVKNRAYFYDAADRLVRDITYSATGGENRALVYVYDSLDRMVRKIIQREGSSTTVEDDAQYVYEDQLDAVLMAAANNNVANLSFSHEAAPPFAGTGFGTSAAQSGNPLGLIEGQYSVTRGVSGEITSIADTAGTILTKSYDPAGRLTNAASGAFNTTITYDSFGRKASVQHSTGEVGSFTYDLLNRIVNIDWTGPTPIHEGLTYDLAGNITQLVRENGNYILGYNSVDEITSSSSTGAGNFVPYNRTLSYSLVGDRLNDSLNGNGIYVGNMLLSNNAYSFLADSAGFGDVVQETFGGNTKNYSYRADGKIRAFQSGNLAVNYFYDGRNRLITKAVNANNSQFVQSFVHVEGSNVVLQGKAGDGSVTKYIDGQNTLEHLAEIKSGMIKGYISDHLGSIINGDVAGVSHQFGLFGEVIGSPALGSSSNPAMYGFAGHLYDAESGLNRALYRQYHSRIGQWMSQEPSGNDGPNFYWYAHSNPLRYIDPDGLESQETNEGGSQVSLYCSFGGCFEGGTSDAKAVANLQAGTAVAAGGVAACAVTAAPELATFCTLNPEVCSGVAVGAYQGITGDQAPFNPASSSAEAVGPFLTEQAVKKAVQE